MPSLSSKFEKEGKKGLVVIGVTDESQSTVDAWYAKAQPRYPIAILKDKSFEKALGVRFFPTAGVIAPDGKLTYAGSAGSKGPALKEALSDATKAPLWPSKLSKVQGKLGEGDLAAAWAELGKLKAGKDAELDRWAKRFSDTVAEQAASAFERAKAYADDGVLYRGVELVEPLAEAKTPLPISEAAGEWLRAQEAESGYDDELKAGALHAKARKLEAEKDWAAAAKQYVKAADKYPDTRLAEAALERVVYLVNAGLPGYKSTCGNCKRSKKACSKHEVTIKT